MIWCAWRSLWIWKLWRGFSGQSGRSWEEDRNGFGKNDWEDPIPSYCTVVDNKR